ncbi:carbohydrate ABC transporter permease [Leifsonia aquatica]|uniref:carbohydrate ABC transporter permease n=1 Tax=Leifsonia aquatica TaxID=144185 RepID=UPI00384FDB1C
MTTSPTLARTVPGAPAPRRGFTLMRRSQLRAIALLLAPFLALYVLAYAIPLCYAVYESFFTEKRSGLGFGGGERVFAAFDNYAHALAMPEFTAGVGRVLLLGVVQVPLMLIAALLLALALDALATRFAAFVRLAAFLPYAVPGVIAAILWAFLYLGGTSPFVQALKPLGVDLNLLSADTVLWSMGNIITWTWTGYNMIIIYSALKAVPRELYEAAAMDGAGPVRVAWSIKVPLVAPALTLTGVFSIVGTVQLYNEPMLLRPFSPAIDASYTPNMTVQNVAFTMNDYGLAAAMAVLLALGTAVLSFGFMRISGAMTSRKATI